MKEKEINVIDEKLKQHKLSKEDWKEIDLLLRSQINKKHSESPNQVADLIKDISIEEYEALNYDNPNKKLSMTNMKRAKRVIFIRKHKYDKYKDTLQEHDAEKYKNFNADLSRNEMEILKRSVVPDFLRKKIKISTNLKFKSLKGLYG